MILFFSKMNGLREIEKFKEVILHILTTIHETVNDFYQENVIDDNPEHLRYLKELLRKYDDKMMIDHMLDCHMFWIGLIDRETKNIKHVIDKYNKYSPVDINLLIIPFIYVDETELIDVNDLNKIWNYIHILIKIAVRYVIKTRQIYDDFRTEIDIEFFKVMLEIEI